MPCSCQGAGKPETDITLRYPDKTAELNAYLDALPLEAHPDRKRGVLIQSLHRAQQIFGYLRASSSKRHFLHNYFEYIGRDIDLSGKEDVRIIEDTRDYRMPIYEGRYGTDIYTDYILCTYKEHPQLEKYLKRGIIDSLFIEDEVLFRVLRDYKYLNEDNAYLLENNLKLAYGDLNFDKGYLYAKTNITK